MKAIVIKTGEVVEVHKTITGWASDNLNTTRFFNESELDFDYHEWETVFRREATKDFTVALVSSGSGLNPKTIAYAIQMTEELIKQLKEEKMKRNKQFDELLARVPEETKRRVDKQLSCKWLRNGDECGKGLPGTPCEVVGCVAWQHYKED